MIHAEVFSWKGHEDKEWDPGKPGALEEMKEFFKEKLSKGFRAFALDKEGNSHPITEFDEAAERVVMTAEKVTVLGPTRGG